MGSYYPSKQPGVSDGMDTGAPHSRLMLPDCWWCSFCCQLCLQTGLGMLSQRQVCVRVQVAGKGALGLPLSHEDSFHRRERSQPPKHPFCWSHWWAQKGRGGAGRPAWQAVSCSWRSPGATNVRASRAPRIPREAKGTAQLVLHLTRSPTTARSGPTHFSRNAFVR